MKAIIRSIFGVVMMAMATVMQAQFEYVTNADGITITITGYSSSGPDAVVIPPMIDGLHVTSIGDNAFEGLYELTSVTIPDGVTNIAEEAFENCVGLTSVVIPDSVLSIGDNAFDTTGLTSVRIPGSVSNLGGEAFDGSGNLTNVAIAFGVSSIVGAFPGCPGLTNIIIPSSVTNLGDYAFGQDYQLAQVFFTGNAPAVDTTVFLNFHLVGDQEFETYFDVSTAYYLPGTTGWAEFTSNTFIAAAPPSFPTNIFVSAVLWNPVIRASGASFGVQSNQFGFDITGTTDIPIVVEACTNLAQPVWAPLQSMTLTNGLVHFSEPIETNVAARFYRIGAP